MHIVIPSNTLTIFDAAIPGEVYAAADVCMHVCAYARVCTCVHIACELSVRMRVYACTRVCMYICVRMYV